MPLPLLLLLQLPLLLQMRLLLPELLLLLPFLCRGRSCRQQQQPASTRGFALCAFRG